MTLIGRDMVRISSFGLVGDAGVQLVGAARIAESWAEDMEKGLRE